MDWLDAKIMVRKLKIKMIVKFLLLVAGSKAEGLIMSLKEEERKIEKNWV
jgi:hypothetical protein